MADPDEDYLNPPVAKQALPAGPQGQATDMSQQGNLRKAWDSWTSRPENNAAMINFGLQLMQPIAPGQSRLGHYAEAIGAGAEGSSRNVAAQEERAKEEAKQEIAEREEARKETETGYYGQAVKSQAAARADTGGIKALAAKNKAYATAATQFNKWLDDPLDMGSYWQNIKTKYGIKDKAEIQGNPELKKKIAQEYMRDHLAEAMTESGYYDRGGGEGGGAEGGGGFTPPPGAVIRYQGNKPVYFNPATKQPYPGQD
jgi:hypothetical protein